MGYGLPTSEYVWDKSVSSFELINTEPATVMVYGLVAPFLLTYQKAVPVAIVSSVATVLAVFLTHLFAVAGVDALPL